MSLKFFKCENCGNVIVKVVDSGVTPVCCGRGMTELKPLTFGGMWETHVPASAFFENDMLHVSVGLAEHPMTHEHFIRLVAVETEDGFLIRYFKPGEKAVADFCLCGQQPVAIYEYCNLHGLWKTSDPGKGCTSGGCGVK